MNCPMHILIYRARGRSYRELPLRMFEFGTVYRYEKSGVIHGLTRVRGMTQDDAHIFCTQRADRATSCASLLTFVLDLLRDYGLDDFYLELSTEEPGQVRRRRTRSGRRRPRPCAEVAAESGLELVPDPGGAAFYGPKISVQARDAIGRTWQMSTIQLDFNLPERFELEYQGADGARHRPVMIHRALFGSIERFFAVLTEHYAGAFPAWLAPVQVVGIPVTEEHVAVPRRGRGPAAAPQGIRVEVDASDDRMQKKIRTAQQAEGAVHADRRRRRRGGRRGVASATATASQRNGVPLDQASTRSWRSSAAVNVGPSAALFDERTPTGAPDRRARRGRGRRGRAGGGPASARRGTRGRGRRAVTGAAADRT